jgi:fructose-1,6-bisphosphatase I
MKRISLTQYLVEEQREHNTIPAELRLLIEVVARACKTISGVGGQGRAGRRAGREAESENVQGEAQKKLDVIQRHPAGSQRVGRPPGRDGVGRNGVHPPIPNRYPKGEYLLLFDPLDGSSNIDVNVSIGTIFSVLKAPTA